MLTVRIIPCLDVSNGRVVKGVQFENLRDAGDPVELAQFYNDEGADELIFLDITASKENRRTVVDMARQVAECVFIPFTIGGGINSVEDIHELLNAGADKVTINSSALENPDLINESAKQFGSQCIVIAVDVKRDGEDWNVFSHGGSRNAGRNAIEWIREVEDRGAGEIMLTSMDCDGSQDGFDLDITHKVSNQLSIPVIASGGCGTLEHFLDAVTTGKADAVLAASVFHYRTFSINQVKEYLHAHNIPVRLR